MVIGKTPPFVKNNAGSNEKKTKIPAHSDIKNKNHVGFSGILIICESDPRIFEQIEVFCLLLLHFTVLGAWDLGILSLLVGK